MRKRFGHVIKRLNQKDKDNFKMYNVTNKQLQYKYGLISQEVKEIRY